MGLSQSGAIQRGEAYVEAAADALLEPSKQKTPDEILASCRGWSRPTAMRGVFHRILAEGAIGGLEADIASVAEIFEWQGDARMRDIEKVYLR